MSYIEDRLYGNGNNVKTEIKDFLLAEGFEEGTNPFRGGSNGCMKYYASGNFVVWFCVHKDFIDLTQEYDCGGTLGSDRLDFDPDDMDDFMEKYEEAVEWTADRIN